MSEWTEESLGRLASIEIGGTPSRDVPAFWASENAEGFPWASIADLGPRFVSATKERITRLGVLSSNVKPVKSGTLIMSFKLTIGRAGIAACDLFTNEAIAAFVPAQQTLDGNFLYYLLPPIARNAVTDVAIKGSTLNKQTLSKLKLRFPKDMRQQRRIAEILSTLDEAIEQTEALIAKHKQIKAGLMHDLFTRGVTPDGHLRPTREQAPDLYKESPLGWIPKEWSLKTISTIADSLVDGPFGSNLKSEHYVAEPGVRVVRLQNIQEGYYNDRDPVFVSQRHADYLMRNAVNPGDVLIAALGDESYPVGRACCYPPVLPPAINKADCFRLRCHPEVAINTYVMHFLNTAAARNQVKRFEQGVTRCRTNLGNLRRVIAALPDLFEQECIIQRLAVFGEPIKEAELQAEKLRQQKHGLMHDLLTGKVRVAV